ncbi:hypothetical protein KQX54_016945 [Cotesia glomerata]|uniref:Uncharacterized protein n=1 Tax=Cotesia glomerata TaxID=32391 RepID=A0AAV7J7Y3_COTGL|nr:hypothetical protein KQX54_016945 [Cotesia glomerata]
MMKNVRVSIRRLQRAFTTAQAASKSEDSYKPTLRCKIIHEEIQAILNESSSSNNGSIVATESCNEHQSTKEIVIESMELKFLLVEKQMTSAKRSILYDIGQKYQTHSSHKSKNSAASTNQADESRQLKMNVSFPIEDLAIFLSFDEDLKINIKMRNAVKIMFNAWTYGSCDYDKDIKKIMAELLKKEIQILYSGVVRVRKGVGKENFSATEVFSLIRD